MKIYQINVVCSAGSTGRIITDISRYVEQQGDHCRIAYGRGNAENGVDTIKIETKWGCIFHAVMTRFTDRHGLYSKRATKRLIEDIRQYEPDIIHLHNIHGYYLNYELLFKFLKKYDKPVVWTLHDCWTFTGHCAHFDAVRCDKWKTKCENCCQTREYPTSVLRDASTENYVRKQQAFCGVEKLQIVTVSDWLKRMVQSSYLSCYPIRTIYNGIDLQVMRPCNTDHRNSYNLGEKKVILGVASIWNEKKGMGLFRELAERLPEDYRIVMIGVPEKLRSGLPDKILCLGKVGYEELAKWYSTADIYVNGSIEETMGLTTVEAMACGTPVVVQNATAVPEVVGEGCGIVVEKGDIEGMTVAIHRISKTPEISARCREHAERYEKSGQYEQYYRLYQELVNS